ncbi:hypothetical protein CEP51_004473 [Fusarium floridanum]|uniref:Uncharacterized protein n=1 Tax=Fusarium floridanum TaxID=1325733 RepID=A0A428S1Q1_9HYPO|nr:hypothetical protein CEP51_004473 [Fusarium floridanum]
MSDHQEFRPALLSARRRFGRCEPFRRFDHVASHASVAAMSIGSMTVDCQFLFEKSQWGVLKRFPAGIVYMDLNFGPPQGCRVKSATITVTLDEFDEALAQYKNQPPGFVEKSPCPVHMTECYGPRYLLGEEKSTEFKQTTSAAPEIHASGVGVGGVGVSTEKSFKSSSRWSFNGQLLSGKGHWAYRTLRWNLNYNELESQSFQKGCVHTAFSFHHGGQPFLMKVEIEGKLGRSDRMKSKLRFGSNNYKEDGQVTTLIDFRETRTFQKRLDRLAESLPSAMEWENSKNIPIEIPDAAPASFHTASPGAEDSTPNEMEPPQGGISKHEPLETAPNAPAIETGRVSLRLKTQEIQPQQNATVPTEQNIARLIRRLTRPIEPETIGRSLEGSCPSVSSTVVDLEEEQEQTSHSDEKKTELALASLNADQEAMLKILQIPALLTFLQLIATLMDMLGRSRKAKTVKS